MARRVVARERQKTLSAHVGDWGQSGLSLSFVAYDPIRTFDIGLSYQCNFFPYGQANSLSIAAQKMATYRSLRFLNWQPWCRRSAQFLY